MQLTTERGGPIAVANFNDVRDVLLKLDEDSFAILDDGGRFIQTAFDGDGLVIEKSGGADEPLYRASRNGSEKFALTDVEAVFQAWYDHSPLPPDLRWSVEDDGGTPRPFYWLIWALPLVGGAFLIYELVRRSDDVWKIFR